MNIVFVIFTLMITSCLANDGWTNPASMENISPYAYETDNKLVRISISQTQKALLEVPEIKQTKKKYEKKTMKIISDYINKETAAALGAIYITLNKKEISTKHIKRFSIPVADGSFRPDVGFKMDQGNFYMGLFYTKAFK